MLTDSLWIQRFLAFKNCEGLVSIKTYILKKMALFVTLKLFGDSKNNALIHVIDNL